MSAALTLLAWAPSVVHATEFSGAPRLGARVDPRIELVDDLGRSVQLGALFDGTRPVLLTFNYFRCHGVCDLQLRHLALGAALAFRERREAVRIVSVSFDPKDSAADARAKRAVLLDGASVSAPEWRLFVGSPAVVAKLASTLGVTFRYDPASQQYAHAPLTLVLSPNGTLVRFLLGTDFSPRDLRLAAAEAAQGRRSADVVDRVLLSCFRYDPASGHYSFYVLGAVRAAAVLTLLLCVVGWLVLRRHEARSATPGPGAGA
jgi:protein SCO1/2